MKRRSLIASIGAVAAGSAAVGTGAFTTAEAERTLNIEVADEDTAVLALSRIEENDEGEYVQPLGGRKELSFDFNDTDGTDGFGPGTNSTYRFDRLFAVENQGSQPIFFRIDEFADAGGPGDEELENIGIYVEEADADEYLLDGDNAVLELGVGEPAEIGFKIDTDGVDVEFNDDEPFTFDATVTASDEAPEDVTILDEDGEVVNIGNGGI